MSYEVGSRVTAISHVDEAGAHVFGDGIYVGDKPSPGTRWPCHPDDYKMIADVVTQNDHLPIEEHPFVGFYDVSVKAQPDVPPKKNREEMIAGLLAERERPLDDRVRELYESSRENPCIHLDSGDTVWGFQCWWGPIARVNERLGNIERTTVPVPEGNTRWKE